jgi:hypothetical protein
MSGLRVKNAVRSSDQMARKFTLSVGSTPFFGATDRPYLATTGMTINIAAK